MGREASRAEDVPRSPKLIPEKTTKVKDDRDRKDEDRRGAGEPHADVSHAATSHPATSEPDVPEAAEVGVEEDDIPIGQVEAYIEVESDGDAIMEDDLPDLAIAETPDVDVGPAGPYEQDSDDESANDGEPPAKRARELQVCISKRSEAHSADGVRRDFDAYRSLMATSEVKRILKELDGYPELQLPKQQRRSADATIWNTACAEIYSHPRIT